MLFQISDWKNNPTDLLSSRLTEERFKHSPSCWYPLIIRIIGMVGTIEDSDFESLNLLARQERCRLNVTYIPLQKGGGMEDFPEHQRDDGWWYVHNMYDMLDGLFTIYGLCMIHT